MFANRRATGGGQQPGRAGPSRTPRESLAVCAEVSVRSRRSESPGTWYAAHSGDVVFSSIDLWKGCIALVPDRFDGALVTKEFPIYRVRDGRLLPEFLQALLRSRYYKRAFRAITTGHSNRRRTQVPDFEDLQVAFPPSPEEQRRLIEGIATSRAQHRAAATALQASLWEFSHVIDGRGEEELPQIDDRSNDKD